MNNLTRELADPALTPAGTEASIAHETILPTSIKLLDDWELALAGGGEAIVCW